MSEGRFLREALRRRWPLRELTGLDDTRDALLDAYGDPRRGYHDLLHLTEVLDRLVAIRRDDDHDELPVQLAAWFHDAVYDSDPEPEERSARWARDALMRHGVPGVAEVVRLIRLTVSHDVSTDDRNGGALCDADLGILATPSAARYADYVAGVRREYAAYPLHDFAFGRAAVLRRLLSRPPLFHTRFGRTHWETRALHQVEQELRVLDELAGHGSA